MTKKRLYLSHDHEGVWLHRGNCHVCYNVNSPATILSDEMLLIAEDNDGTSQLEEQFGDLAVLSKNNLLVAIDVEIIGALSGSSTLVSKQDLEIKPHDATVPVDYALKEASFVGIKAQHAAMLKVSAIVKEAGWSISCGSLTNERYIDCYNKGCKENDKPINKEQNPFRYIYRLTYDAKPMRMGILLFQGLFADVYRLVVPKTKGGWADYSNAEHYEVTNAELGALLKQVGELLNVEV